MSINNSYFSRNNTIISNSFVNTGRNPVFELFYGDSGIAVPIGYSRFIFDLDLTLLKEKINEGIISLDCNKEVKHVLKVTNTVKFNKEEYLNTSNSQGRKRATSFDLILFRIPYRDLDPSLPQRWDEGVGYDFANTVGNIFNDKNYSDRPSNWYQTTTLEVWEQQGIYDNKNTGTTNFNDLIIVDTQHFEFGNEDIEFDMTSEINAILDGSFENPVGWGIAYLPQVENLEGLDGTYSVEFFSRHTQTFYEPFLETTYDDLIEDDRNSFSLGKVNKLYLYIYEDGDFQNLDELPVVTITDASGEPITNLTSLTACSVTKGVYEIVIPPLLGYKTPCSFGDKWSNIKLNGFTLPDVYNEFVVYPIQKSIQIGTSSLDPKTYGFDYYGIKQDEKILNTDLRKVSVIIKQAFTTNKQLPNVDSFYRIYVREGQTEVQVQDWTKLNRTPNEYYLIFDTRDKIPNEYYIDLKVISSGEVNTYKRTIKFQIVNKK
jgi:hypothetical protein